MVDFAAISPHLNIRISPKAKRLALRLDSHAGCINLVIPHKSSMKKAYEFAQLNQSWIIDKIGSLPSPVPFIDEQTLTLMGKEHKIKIEICDRKYTEIKVIDGEIRVKTQLDDPSSRISRFLRKLAETELKKIADQKAAILERKLTGFCVRDMKSRWGSCSTDGRMTLSWRLIFAPYHAMDYVVSHETAHLIHANHGKKFWELCSSLSTDYSTGKEWMRLNGVNLGKYGKSPSHLQKNPEE
ncbi:MAG: M48 family metallopeptidase [Alphaproteobacteria bacterium]|nr:M48 family metallopeptidase [Alphaproteobacteria bacterium]MCB9985015.1 M48 family metallopeptidase [Micavibrio sp.]